MPACSCRRLIVFLLLTLVSISSTSISSTKVQAEDGWKAGVAKEVITPPEPMWMSGYAGRDKPAEGTLHELWAKAVVLQDPHGKTLVLVTLDLVGIDRQTSQKICKQLQDAHQLERSQIALSTSHTHTGPVVGSNLTTMYQFDERNQKLIDDYTVFLQARISSAVAKAFGALQPSVIRYGEGHCSVAVNRRNNREADVPMLRAAGMLNGPVDHTAPVLSVRSPEGKLRAVVFGYACHATVLSFFQWSGDWPGFAQIEIEKLHPDAIALFWAGCGADQNPLPRRTVEIAEAYGRQVATSVDQVLSSPMKEVKGGLTAQYQEIDLALGQLPSREQIEKDAASSDIFVVRRAKQLLRTIEKDGKLSQTYPYPIQVWGIGSDVNMVFLGGEVVVEYSLRLKAELPEPMTWVAGYSNDVMAYIPSARVLKEGGYEGASSMIYYGLPTVWSSSVEEDISRAVGEVRAKVRAH